MEVYEFSFKTLQRKKIKNALIIQAEIKALSVEKTCINKIKLVMTYFNCCYISPFNNYHIKDF